MVTKGLLYYTCNTHDRKIEMAARRNLLRVCNGYEVGCVSRQPTDFGNWNVVVDLPYGAETLHKQILAGLEVFQGTDVIFFCENDVLYHPSHFDFVPPRNDIFYYNTNIWKVRSYDGHAIWTDDLQQTSGLCANRDFLFEYYTKRIERISKWGFDRHFEPGPKTGNYRTSNWCSTYPNIDIRHGKNLTKSKWSPDEFRNQKYARGWKEASEIEGWGITEGRFDEFLKEINYGAHADPTATSSRS